MSSWQRILEAARRHGMPLIVTDVAGREPLVVLPFDEFERLTEKEVEPHKSENTGAGIGIVRKQEEKKTNFGEVKDLVKPVDNLKSKGVSQSPITLKTILQEVAASTESEAVSNGEEEAELSLEERFYLEPVDEEENNP
ncbi:MAG TPA: hypothetical protein VFQ60_03815 [Patescibacteria group bacterium]|nr:hypothetical protein [Patescibacteria group bacterium]